MQKGITPFSKWLLHIILSIFLFVSTAYKLFDFYDKYKAFLPSLNSKISKIRNRPPIIPIFTETNKNSVKFFQENIANEFPGLPPEHFVETDYDGNMKSAIVGLISKYSVDYIKPFFLSLACTGYNGAVIIFYRNIPNETMEFLVNVSSVYEMQLISVTSGKPYISTNLEIHRYKNRQLTVEHFPVNLSLCDYCYHHFVKNDERVEIWYCLNENHFFDEYELLLFTDVGDVIIQNDIRNYNYSKGIYISEEARYPIEKDPYWIYEWAPSAHLNYSKYPKLTIICVGTIMLYGRESFCFLKDLHDQIKDREHLIVNHPNYQGAIQMFVHNKTKTYPPGFLHFNTNDYGITDTVGLYRAHLQLLQEKFNIHGNLYTLQYHDQNYVLYNLDFVKFAVIHHIRYRGETIEKTLPGLYNLCLHYYPKIHQEFIQ
ncbi:hypothetical protein TRFO_27216 [Tritrichomonas foetus]|uniref:Uncharacterized protein n=1 Tax=Tritrichomonas foetus TaxID=1144522 RepID=A0A1J4K621_9EUKA|nr:hypothetical protein TRFO_27216 [Tritrichomonas foetus]|eukprot:OHT05148.1 hypothetical protein TRFO_27216 [Tritrichomonas foetus]